MNALILSKSVNSLIKYAPNPERFYPPWTLNLPHDINIEGLCPAARERVVQAAHLANKKNIALSK